MPERPIGTALKAVAGRNVSRGFESRPLCVTKYRLDRAQALVAVGVLFVVAAVLVVVAFLASAWVWVAVVVVALVAFRLVLVPPVVVRFDENGFRGRVRTAGVGSFRGRWVDVTDAQISSNVLRLTCESGPGLQLPLVLVQNGRRAELVRDVYSRLNTANGYQRYDVQL